MPLAMIIVYKRLKKRNLLQDVKIINQVHDSLICDLPDKYVPVVADICIEVFKEMPQHINSYWGYNWTVPLAGEVKYGINWSDMIKYKK